MQPRMARGSQERLIDSPASIRYFAIWLAALCLGVVLCTTPTQAYATNSAFDDTSSETAQYIDEYTGNAFLANRDVTNVSVGCDLYWAGEALKASNVVTGADGSGDALLAGQSIALTGSEIRGSLRAAAQDITVASTSIANNITVAGQDIAFASDVSAKGLYVAGDTLQVAGTYQSASLVGDTVTLAGTFEGDVHISAASVTVLSSTVIEGTLYVPEDASLEVADDAQVQDTIASGTVGSAPAGPLPLGVLVGLLIFSCVAHILLMLVYWFFGKDAIRDAARMSRERVGSLALTGLVIFFATPLIALLLLIPVVTMPISVLMGIVMVTVWLFSIPFAGAALGCQIFHRMSPKCAAIVGVLIVTVLCYVPYLLPIIPTLTTIYTIGYVGQKVLIKRRAAKRIPTPSESVEG